MAITRNSSVQSPPPIRIGVFHDVEEASRAIEQLRGAGFAPREIKVVCSNPAVSSRFVQYVDQQPAGARTPRALTRAAWLFGLLALIGLAVGLFSGPTTTLIVLSALLGVGLLIGFGSIMMTRGSERELSDYYDQAVVPGQVLVAVDLPDDAPPAKLAAADRIFDRLTGGHAAADHE
jgi:hypothetical protein